MTTYRVPVSDALLEHPMRRERLSTAVPGLRMISIDEPGPEGMYYTVCTFEDDTAPPELEGKLVELELKSTRHGAVISKREVMFG